MVLQKRSIYTDLFFGCSLLLLLLLIAPSGVQAFTYDFSGIVLYDSKASDSRRPGFNDPFTGSLELTDKLIFINGRTEIGYEDFGTVSGGNFTQGGQNFFYALSQGESHHSQMGVVWWSDPRSFRVGENFFNNVYGLTFYFDGGLTYTPAQKVSMSLATYLATGYLPTFAGGGNSLSYSACTLATGTAFFGIIETPFVKTKDVGDDDPSAVPLPASLWFLGSGLLFLMRFRKH